MIKLKKLKIQKLVLALQMTMPPTTQWVWDFEGKTHKETCKMFDQIEIAEQFYKGLIYYKTTTRAYYNRAIHGRKQKGVEATSTTNHKKGCTCKTNKNMQGIRAIS